MSDATVIVTFNFLLLKTKLFPLITPFLGSKSPAVISATVMISAAAVAPSSAPVTAASRAVLIAAKIAVLVPATLVV